MSTIGNINPAIANILKTRFKIRCIEMIEWACYKLKETKTINKDWGEENITANIYVLIQNNKKAVDYNIYPECERPLYNHDILNNISNAKTAPRIDLVFQHNWNYQRFSFYVEAKNLIETDVLKTGRKCKTTASYVLNRYITTGIDHFVKEYYPLGCILGYVLKGSISGIINNINTILKKNGRSGECLQCYSGTEPWVKYESHHPSITTPIEHYLFNFNGIEQNE